MSLKLVILFFCSALISQAAIAQNIFPQKVEGCNTAAFCLDCGDTKATFDSLSFVQISNTISSKFNLKGAKGGVAFQVLVDSLGRGCVISHTDVSNSGLTKDLVIFLNAAKWIPAVEKNKVVTSSITVSFKIEDGHIKGELFHINANELFKGAKNTDPPTVYNKTYHYNNVSLNRYTIKKWNQDNSDLPVNMAQHCLIDARGILWYNTIDGLRVFDGKNFTFPDKAPFKQNADVYAISKDIKNNIWLCTGNSIFRYDGQTWNKYDSTRTGISGAYSITPVSGGDVLIGDDKGLAVYKNEQWTLLNKKKIKELPSNRVDFAYRDKAGRLWIGTFSGSVMIDANNKVTAFNSSQTPLKSTTITDAAEDEAGNLYFVLYAYNANGKRNVPEEGIAVYTKNGTWKHYNDENSGLPANHVNNIFYDKYEKALWISSHYAGLVRFDLKSNWEMFNTQNSPVPSNDIYQIAQDNEGNLYVSTYNGLLKLTRK